MARLNIVLLVVDSLRADAVAARPAGQPPLPFFSRLAREAVSFRRAYATECWTLPAHMSLFTGLLPSEHGAHFGDLAYRKEQPTIAELLLAEGYRTDLVTRNPVFDGTLPGVTRGFERNTRVLAELSGLNPLALMLAASKPRFRRQVQASGFFHPLQRESREFIAAFARATVPADRQALDCVLQRMREGRRARQPYFVFANLFDVHAPYPPVERSIFRSPWSGDGLRELLLMPSVLPRLGGHRYLQRGFTMSPLARRLLRHRYDDAVILADRKLDAFYGVAREEGLLDDTVLIVTSDHGEAFGEHDLYLHDASVYDIHLHVPLFVRSPTAASLAVDDVVTTRDLFRLLHAIGRARDAGDTILDPTYREQHPIALAEHTPYPHLANVEPKYTKRLAAAIASNRKFVLRGGDAEVYDLATDRREENGIRASLEDFGAFCAHSSLPRAASDEAMARLQGWRELAA